MRKQQQKKRMPFLKFLKAALGNQIPQESLPRRLRVLGQVAILKLSSKAAPFKKQIGEMVLQYHPHIKSVLRQTDAISGPFRQPSVELIAGVKNTETVFKENKCIFYINPQKVMFSLGNKAERLYMSTLGSNEFIIDMFAGIGQFSIPIAVHSQPQEIHSIEWNPDAFGYLKKNIETNKVEQIVNPYLGDAAVITPSIARGEADRVIMGLIKGTTKYLPEGVECLRPGGILHFHEVGSREKQGAELALKIRTIAKNRRRQATILAKREVKTYNPRLTHYVFDVQIN